jgi:hypothetical protein
LYRSFNTFQTCCGVILCRTLVPVLLLLPLLLRLCVLLPLAVCLGLLLALPLLPPLLLLLLRVGGVTLPRSKAAEIGSRQLSLSLLAYEPVYFDAAVPWLLACRAAARTSRSISTISGVGLK